MGEPPLSEVREASESGYVNLSTLDQLIVGHGYVVCTASGTHAKFHITELDREKPKLVVDWYSRADGSRRFDQQAFVWQSSTGQETGV